MTGTGDDVEMDTVIEEARALFRRQLRPRGTSDWHRLEPLLIAAEYRLSRHLEREPNDAAGWAKWREVRRYLGRRDPDPNRWEPR